MLTYRDQGSLVLESTLTLAFGNNVVFGVYNREGIAEVYKIPNILGE